MTESAKVVLGRVDKVSAPHATIGFAKTLAATGQIKPGRPGFSLETPAGIVSVELAWGQQGELEQVTLTNVLCHLGARDVAITLRDGQTVHADLA